MTSKESGFSLIELIVVIVLLGVIATIALPRFIDLGTDARIAVVKNTKAQLESTTKLARAKILIEGFNGNKRSQRIIINNESILFWYGYPHFANSGFVGVGVEDISLLNK